MTCIVAIKKDNYIYMGGDSAATDMNSGSISIRSHPKIFINKSCIIGFSGSFRIGQLLEYSFVPPAHPTGMSDMEYMCTLFVNKLQSTLETHAMLSTENRHMASNQQLLVGYHGVIYEIEEDFNVGVSPHAYNSIGGGSDIAKGSLHTTEAWDISPTERITAALTAAAEYNTSVKAPFHHLKKRFVIKNGTDN